MTRDGLARFEYLPLTVTDGERTLTVNVMRDAIKFDDMPAMRWNRTVLDPNDRYDGVRPGADGREIQQIADLLDCYLMTPLLLDRLTLEAKRSGVYIDAVTGYKEGGRWVIGALADVHKLHRKIQRELEKAGGDNGGLVAVVGKYWVLSNWLLKGRFSNVRGRNVQLINYGWFSKYGNYTSVTGKLKCYQVAHIQGDAHNTPHFDPAQVIRLVHKDVMLIEEDKEPVVMDLADIMTSPELCGLVSHEGPLKITRVPSVDKLDPLPAGVYSAPPELVGITDWGETPSA